MGYCYRVELTRKVKQPHFGMEACIHDTKQKEFPFGKGKEFLNGKIAKLAAIAFAESMIEQASIVSVWRMSDYKGSGEYLKNDNDLLFDTGWDEVV